MNETEKGIRAYWRSLGCAFSIISFLLLIGSIFCAVFFVPAFIIFGAVNEFKQGMLIAEITIGVSFVCLCLSLTQYFRNAEPE